MSQPTPAVRTFQDLILALQQYWAEQGCVVLQPYDMEVGAGTFHTATFLRAIGPETWNAAYVQQFIKRGVPRRLAEDDRRILARYFEVSEAILGGPQPEPQATRDNLIVVPRLEVGASAGPGAVGEDERVIGFEDRRAIHRFNTD